MMWTRAELKARGKAAFRGNFWRCVLAALILTVLLGGQAGVQLRQNVQELQNNMESLSVQQQFQDLMADGRAEEAFDLRETEMTAGGDGGLGALLGLGTAGGLLLTVFVINPLVVGVYRFFLVNGETGHAGLEELLFGFRHAYLSNVATMFLRGLVTGLGAVLIVPAFILPYSYRLVPYLLAEEFPGGTDTLRESRRMMLGQKWEAFKLDLSFLGWHLLGAITGGLGEIFWAAPYQQATDAQLYLRLMGRAFDLVYSSSKSTSA